MSMILLGILGAQAAGGAAGAYDLLETQVLSSSAASVTFTGLGSYSDYKHLQLRMTLRGSFSSSGAEANYVTFNSDTGSNYAYHRLYGNGSSVASQGLATRTRVQLNDSSPNATSTGDVFAPVVLEILDFSNTTKNKTVRALHGVNIGAEQVVSLTSGLWMNTSAITSIDITNGDANHVAGSRFSLYGVK